MLALKSFDQSRPVPVLIFDEIDAQIGGRLGAVTGLKLKELSRQRQVLAITHLAQIAAYADNHYKVAKSEKDKRTLTTLSRVDGDERISELAQMMGGDSAEKISFDHARDMLARANA